MFKKLLSNLPFNPSLIGQVSFYAQRLHRETVLRRAGLIMIALTMVLQTFAVISPPQASLQASPNTDLINGGFSSKAEAVALCKKNSQKYKSILGHFGISCENLSNAEVTTVKPRDFNGKLYSMGRQAFGVAGETPVRIPGVGTFYVRHFWSLNHEPSYKALKVKNSQGKTSFILFGCGNLVTVGVPAPPPPPPTDVCENIPGIQTNRKECDVCPEIAGIQKDKSLCDQCPNKPGIQRDKSLCDVCPNLPGVQLKESQCDQCPNTTGTQSSQTQCDVCPNKSGVQTTAAQCDVCPNTAGIQIETSKCDACPGTPGTQTDETQCDLCPSKPGVQTADNSCATDSCPNTPGTQESEDECDVCPGVAGDQTDKAECDVCPDKSGVQTDERECKPCEASQTNDDLTACLAYSKKAKNITQNITNADNTVANAGDTIEYVLTTTNSGKITIKDYHVNEALGDVLDYATIIDLHGGTKGEYDVVTWPAAEIKAGKSITNTITIKIKDILPNTPASSTDPTHFDMVMTNVYGNAVNIKLPPSATKQIEITATQLPNTGPGTSLAIGFTLTFAVAYFFARSRLLTKELDIVRVDFGTAGGY